jgi:hypothetical protein
LTSALHPKADIEIGSLAPLAAAVTPCCTHSMATTLRALFEYGYGLIAQCTLCHRFADLDLAAPQVRRLGPDATVPEIRRRLRCTKCGLKRASVQVAAVRW